MRISIIGSGGVATHLAHALQKAGHVIESIFSRTQANADILAAALQSQNQVSANRSIAATCNLANLDSSSELYLIAVKDDALAAIVPHLPQDKLLVHTSGSVDMHVLKPTSTQYGVLYPLQTFSKTRLLNFKQVPLCIEGSDDSARNTLKHLAKSLSCAVHLVNSAQRSKLHLAAVFANNFVNHLYAISEQLLASNEKGLRFELLRPLILETACKVQTMLPGAAQTGPAMRDDQTIITKHLALLTQMDFAADSLPVVLYKLLSEGIRKLS